VLYACVPRGIMYVFIIIFQNFFWRLIMVTAGGGLR